MFRIIASALLALYLLIVGLWPAAVAPVGLAFNGLGVVLAAIPGPVFLLAAVVVWFRHRNTQPATA
ncbi:hypothetical protein [Streptomyces sp. NPDC060188]|uniref:hypothetical protein n=1 Tax=Streptomyces sp. NPDC060188 TaxID=3347068 RepID=UPI003652542D